MKRFLTLVALTCLLSGSALAGDVPTVGAPQPSPQQTTMSTSPGDIPSVGSAEQISDAGLSTLLAAFRFLAV